MTDLHPNILVITLNENRLNTLMKIQRLLDKIKIRPKYILLTRDPF